MAYLYDTVVVRGHRGIAGLSMCASQVLNYLLLRISNKQFPYMILSISKFITKFSKTELHNSEKGF